MRAHLEQSRERPVEGEDLVVRARHVRRRAEKVAVGGARRLPLLRHKEVLGGHFGRENETHVLVIKCIDHRDETAHLVDLGE